MAICLGTRERSVFAAAFVEREVVIAEMTVAYKLIRESFTSRVTLESEVVSIPGRTVVMPFEK